MLILGSQAIRNPSLVGKVVLLLPVPVLFYAFALTKSRGGFLALLAGGSILLLLRYGWRRALVIGAICMPVLVLAAGGRQTDIDLNDSQDTAVGRILLWRDGLMYLKSAPLFGIGWNQYAEESGLVAHNSYIHTFAELGFFGGCMFLGCFFVPMKGLIKLGKLKPPLAAELGEWRPCIMAVGAAYAVGLFSLSRPYTAPTYLAIGSIGAYGRMVLAARPGSMESLSGRLIGQLIIAGICVVMLIMVFVRLFAH
jgi:O-antigen ligase